MSNFDHQPMVPKSTYRLWGELTWDLWKAGYPRTDAIYKMRIQLIRESIQIANEAIQRMMGK